MTMQDLVILIDRLNELLDLLQTHGQALAECERKYKIAVNQKALILQEQGFKVTLIELMIKGYSDIANLRFERDVAKTYYNVTLEKINALKLQIRIVQENLNKGGF